jgi:predicted sulfurtransferase
MESPTATTSATKKKRRLSRKERKVLSKQKKRRVETIDNYKESPAVESQPSLVQKEGDERTKRHEDFLEHYEPISFHDSARTSGNQHQHTYPSVETKVASLGKWFPKAIQLKRKYIDSLQTSTENHRKAAILLFYQYMNPLWSQQKLKQVQDYLIRIGQVRHNIAGRIRIANEGLNATLSAIDDSSGRIDAITTLHYFVQDLYMIDDVFRTQTDFKYITNLSGDRHFHSYHIIPVQELVYYGFNSSASTASAASGSGAKHVPPEIFHRLLAGEDINEGSYSQCQSVVSLSSGDKEVTPVVAPEAKKKDIVVIDVRNHYEAILGRFDGQEIALASAQSDNNTLGQNQTSSVAKYIDPKMRKSTDFPLWVQKNAADLIKKDRILLYCTGGIRCERASEHLSTVLHNELKQYKNGMVLKTNSINCNTGTDINIQSTKDQAPEIYQLQGGIEKYLQAFKDSGGGFWRGKNFTFDKREAISVDNMNGDGGVLKMDKTKSNKRQTADSNHEVQGYIRDCKCVLCNTYWDRYIGKKKCCTCGVPILVCDHCCSTKKDQIRISAKCPICIEEHITIPVSDVAYTNNGKQVKLVVDPVEVNATVKSEDIINTGTPKASSTVLKWGGGHGRNQNSIKASKRKCKFGLSCHHSDCIFDHS